MYTGNNTPPKLTNNLHIMETTKTIAGIAFTNEGISVIRPYRENNELFAGLIPEKFFTDEFVTIAKRLAKARMANCYKKLHSNVASATHITPEMIAWKGGRFTEKAWETLESILEIQDVRQLNFMQCQQLIRAMLLDKQGSNWLYDYDENWEQLKDGDVYLKEEFRLFITEHMLVGMARNEVDA